MTKRGVPCGDREQSETGTRSMHLALSDSVPNYNRLSVLCGIKSCVSPSIGRRSDGIC